MEPEEEIKIASAICYLAEKGWTCIAPGGIDPVALRDAARELVAAVEQYVEPKPGQPYMHRMRLLDKKNKIKKLLQHERTEERNRNRC